MATADVRFVVDGNAVRRYVADGNGDLVRWMLQQGELVKQEAQRLVGVYELPPAGPTRARPPGTLRDSIVKRFTTTADGVVVQVGSEDPIALIHHEGTEPHVIEPRRPGGVLVFWSDRAGAVIAVRRVNHPGTQPNRFLTEALAVLDL